MRINIFFLLFISFISVGVYAQKADDNSTAEPRLNAPNVKDQVDGNDDSFNGIDINEFDDTQSVETSESSQGQLREQELFDQLDTLNFEEAGFYESYRSFIYTPSGRSSPFEKPAALQTSELFNETAPEKAIGAVGLKAYDVQALKVTSLIWNVRKPRALVLDPAGQSHRVEVGTEIGRNDGYVAKIREGELVVIEKQKVSGEDGKDDELFRTQVLKMAR